jgi:hypothetical protein
MKKWAILEGDNFGRGQGRKGTGEEGDRGGRGQGRGECRRSVPNVSVPEDLTAVQELYKLRGIFSADLTAQGGKNKTKETKHGRGTAPEDSSPPAVGSPRPSLQGNRGSASFPGK